MCIRQIEKARMTQNQSNLIIPTHTKRNPNRKNPKLRKRGIRSYWELKMETEISLLPLLARGVTGTEKWECCWKGLWRWEQRRCSWTNVVCDRSWKSVEWLEEALTVNAEANSQSQTLFMVDWGTSSPSHEPPIPLNQFQTFSHSL